MGRSKSPNLGQQVAVKSAQGEHSQYGRIWRCEGKDVQQLTDAGTYQTTGWADFAVNWLQKVKPDSLDKSKSKELDLIGEM